MDEIVFFIYLLCSSMVRTSITLIM